MTRFIKSLMSAGRIAAARLLGLNLSAYAEGRENSDIRLLFVANAFIPTLQLSFIKPLAELVDTGSLATDLLSEQQLKERFGKQLRGPEAQKWIGERFERFRPTAVVFCRYSGPHTAHILELARNAEIPVIFHIDDDLLNVPIEIGAKKYEYHNHPARLAAVRYLLEHSDLVYCSTENLRQRLSSYAEHDRFAAGEIYCSGEVLMPAQLRPVSKIGYMGFDHAHDFELALPSLVTVLQEFPHLTFDLFGSIPCPPALDQFGERIRVIAPVNGYQEFMEKFASLEWDIGICPLAQTDFNAVKANTKWVEYTSVGAAVIASRGTIYDTCCSDGCGLLVDGREEWTAALRNLVLHDAERASLVARAQQRVSSQYSVQILTEQVLRIIELASALRRPALATPEQPRENINAL